MLFVLLANLALCHPFGAQFAAHRTELWVATDEVAVSYTAEVPLGVVRRAARRPEDDPVAETWRMLRSGLILQVNGQPVPLMLDDPSPISAEQADDAMRFTLRLRADLDAPPKQVELGNANMPEVLSVFNSAVTVGPGLLVDHCSLWKVADGSLLRDETDRWRTEEVHRTLRVEVQQPSPWMSAVAAWYRPEPAPRLATAARTPHTAEIIRSPSFRVGIATLVVFCLGLGVRWSGRPRD